MKFCEKEKDCPIYLIHKELNGHYQRLIDELLGNTITIMEWMPIVAIQSLVRICYMRSGE